MKGNQRQALQVQFSHYPKLRPKIWLSRRNSVSGLRFDSIPLWFILLIFNRIVPGPPPQTDIFNFARISIKMIILKFSCYNLILWYGGFMKIIYFSNLCTFYPIFLDIKHWVKFLNKILILKQINPRNIDFFFLLKCFICSKTFFPWNQSFTYQKW